ncbi:MAG TPA: TIGR00730 family Rossman fold protein [Acidimicrobiales bacterium]
MSITRLTVFCGSSPGADPAHLETATALGRELAERGIGLVYGGAHLGLMGALADAALDAGGDVIGVMTEALVDAEIAHTGLPELHVVPTMHERKALMADLGDGFCMLPGGYGTLDEFCEAVTWTQLGIHHKPCGVLDPTGYYAPLLELLDRATEQRFIRPEHRGLVLAAKTVPDLLDRLETWTPLPLAKWLDTTDR